jgi:hypothetical protein
MWARWVLVSLVAVAVIAYIVISVGRAGPEGAASEAGAEAEDNRIADITITEDQAPRVAPLPAGSAPVPALEQAISGDVRRRIADGQLTGPLQSVSCAQAGGGSAGRRPYRCSVRSADIAYPFLAVVDERAGRLTWCKVDQTPAGGGPEVPVSAACRA